MSLEKCQKYLYKLSNTNADDEKFGLYLTKLNYWYEQMGGVDCTTIKKEKECTQNKECEFKDKKCNQKPIPVLSITPGKVKTVQKKYNIPKNVYDANVKVIQDYCNTRNEKDCYKFPSIPMGMVGISEMCYWNGKSCNTINNSIVDECNTVKTTAGCNEVNSKDITLDEQGNIKN